MSDALLHKLLHNTRRLRYTFSSPEDLIPSLLQALEIALFPIDALDQDLIRAGLGFYPVIYTHYRIGFMDHIACSDVGAWLDRCRQIPHQKQELIGFASSEQQRRFPHLFKVLFPTRSTLTQQIDKRIIEHVLDFHEGEYWVQFEICQNPLSSDRLSS